jgi:hypothetical protein
VNRLALLCAIGALSLAAAPLSAASRVVSYDNASATHWFRCAFSGSCIPQAAYQLRKVEAPAKTRTAAETVTQEPAPPSTTTQPWIKNK